MKQTEQIQQKSKEMASKINEMIVNLKIEIGDCHIDIDISEAHYIGADEGRKKIKEQEVTLIVNIE